MIVYVLISRVDYLLFGSFSGSETLAKQSDATNQFLKTVTNRIEDTDRIEDSSATDNVRRSVRYSSKICLYVCQSQTYNALNCLKMTYSDVPKSKRPELVNTKKVCVADFGPPR